MVRRRPATVMATAALLFGAGGPALASDELPGSDSRAGAGLRRQRDRHRGAERALRPRGVQAASRTTARSCSPSTRPRPSAPSCARRATGSARTIEDAATRAAVAEERDAQRERDTRRAREYAESGVPKRKAAVAPPGETVIQRAHKFTNYAGTFLYVEAHNKATIVHRHHDGHRPVAGAVLRGRRRRLRRGDQHGAPDRHHDDAGHVPCTTASWSG